jgi:Dyp-type peroxidase family
VWSDQNSREAEPQLDIDDIQGDILVGLQKDFEWFLFFRIVDLDKFQDFARKRLVPRVSSAADALQWESALQGGKKVGQTPKLPFLGLNLGFTKPGLDKLLDNLKIGGIDDSDHAFDQGMADRSRSLNDPDKGKFSPGEWKVGGRNNTPHGVILITGPTQAIVDRVKEELTGPLQANQDRSAEEFVLTAGERANGWKVIYAECGMTRPNNRRREHFGFLDGVSQPGIRGRIDRVFPDRKFLQPDRNPNDPTETSQGSDLVWPGEFVFGYPSAASTTAGVIDPDGPGNLTTCGVQWTRNGSLMVLRRLNQLVPEFNRFVVREADANEADRELFGARTVGRWKSGAPLSVVPFQDDSCLGSDGARNNDFDFGADPKGRRCPLSAHIRRAYSRSTDTAYSHRLIRRGIPFGPEVNPEETKAGQTGETVERGLMFVCYQTSIYKQFEFITDRLNNREAGPDPLLNFIHPTGGGYFFMPSLSIFKTLVTTGQRDTARPDEQAMAREFAFTFDRSDLKQVFRRLRDLFNAGDYDDMRPLLDLGITWKMLHHSDSFIGVEKVIQWLKDRKAYLNPQFLPDATNMKTGSLPGDDSMQISGLAEWQTKKGGDRESIQYNFSFTNQGGRWFLKNSFGAVT